MPNPERPPMGTLLPVFQSNDWERDPDSDVPDPDPYPDPVAGSGGCGCRTSSDTGGAIGSLLIVLAAFAGRRRRKPRKKPYAAPAVTFRENMELMAVACTGGFAKGNPGACPMGPISS